MNKATYDIEEIKKLIPEAKGTTITVGTGGLNLTIETIVDTVLKNYELIQEFAQAIQGKTLLETSYNIWHFIKTQTVYQKDKKLYEEIRTPQRTVSDKKGDCDDYSIFAASILKALGYEPFFYVVAFSGNSEFGHIYTGVENVVVDGVMNEFNEHPDNITKTMIVKLSGKKEVIERSPKLIKNVVMIVQQLAGMPDDKYSEFVNLEYERLKDLQGLSEIEKDHFNRIKLLKVLEGTGHRDLGRIIIPAASKVDDSLDIYFADAESAQEADNFIKQYEELQGLGNLEGLGSLFSKLKKWHKKQVAKAKATIKKAVSKAKKVTQFVKKVSFAPARGAFLLLLKLNFLHFAEKLYITYLPNSTVVKLGLDMKAFQKLVNFRKKFENFWVKAGGKKSTIFKVVSGRGKRKAKKKYNINGLGCAGACTGTAAAAAASPFIVFFKNIWKAVKEPFGRIVKELKKKVSKKLKDGKLLEKGKALIKQYKHEKQQTQQEDFESFSSKEKDTTNINTETGDAEKKGSLTKLLPAAAVIGVLFMLMK